MKTGKLGMYTSICFVLIIVTLLLVGCKASNTAKGTAIGAGTGAVIGGIIGHSSNTSLTTVGFRCGHLISKRNGRKDQQGLR